MGTAPQGSLARRLVLATLGFCLLFSVCAVALRTWSAWRSNVAAMSEELALVERIYRQTLSKAIWDMDRVQLQTHVQSLVQDPAIGRVTVSVHATDRAPELFDRMQANWQPSSLAPVRRSVLAYEPFPGGRETVGELMLYGDERVLWQRLRGEMAAIGFTQLLQSLLLASLVMLMFSRLVTVHVRRIARHLSQLTPETLHRPLMLNRSQRRNDELTLLVDGVNQLQGNLQGYLQRQLRYEHELAGHRDRLAELVQERTTELEAANAQLQALSRTDALTGLANRRQFDEAKHTEFLRSKRNGQVLCVLVCDIDHFKDYNDTYGHATGDECLRMVAGALRDTVRRAGDLVARIGGEEFGILLPATGREAGLRLAEQVRLAVAGLGMAHPDSGAAAHVTLSIGLGWSDPAADERFDALFLRADRALYRAKRAGRDRIAWDVPQEGHGDPSTPEGDMP